MRHFLDTEFYEDGRTIDLISIGVVAEDGRTFYACNLDADWPRINREPWLVANVVPHLPEDGAVEWMTREKIRDRLLAFVGSETPEFWAYYADYDWVALCQLFGRMIDLPAHFPKFCRDLKQLAVDKGNPTLPVQTSGEHDALADARWNREVYAFLTAKQAAPMPSADERHPDAPCGRADGDPCAWCQGTVFVAGERPAIVKRLRELADADDPAMPIAAKRGTARFLHGVATVIEIEGKPPPAPSSCVGDWPARFRLLADRLEERPCAPSLDGYDLVDGLRAAANLITGSDGSFVHTDDAVGLRLEVAPRMMLREYEATQFTSATKGGSDG